MEKVFTLLLIALSFYADAGTLLTPVNVRPYEKSIYNESIKHSIEGGTPLEKQSFTLTENGKDVGTFIAGRGFNTHDDNVCFVGWSEKIPAVKTVIPTIGFDDWEAEVCYQTRAVGIISNKNDKNIKIAVIYEAASPNSVANETLIFTVIRPKGDIELDKELTNKIGSSGYKTIKELKDAYLK